jgi:hypothetical protein
MGISSDKRTQSGIMTANTLKETFASVFQDIRERSTVADRFIDRNLYQVYIATLWSNVVLAPEDVGLLEDDLEALHDVVIEEIQDAVGPKTSLHSIFEFIASKEGERAMAEARLNQSHKDLLTYFASMILDPSGHKKFMDEIRNK